MKLFLTTFVKASSKNVYCHDKTSQFVMFLMMLSLLLHQQQQFTITRFHQKYLVSKSKIWDQMLSGRMHQTFPNCQKSPMSLKYFFIEVLTNSECFTFQCKHRQLVNSWCLKTLFIVFPSLCVHWILCTKWHKTMKACIFHSLLMPQLRVIWLGKKIGEFFCFFLVDQIYKNVSFLFSGHI